MNDFDRQGLRVFVRGGEKSPPPVFVGRDAISRDIKEAAAAGWNGKGSDSHGTPGMTRIIQGAPGAGKSSILAELQSRSVKNGKQPGAPRVVVATSEKLVGDFPEVLADIGAAGKPSRSGWISRAKAAAGRLRGIGAPGPSVGIFPNDKEERSGAPQTIVALARRRPPKKWVAPVIVAFDEAQNLSPDRHSYHAMFLQALHNATAKRVHAIFLARLGFSCPGLASAGPRGCVSAGAPDITALSRRGRGEPDNRPPLRRAEESSLRGGSCAAEETDRGPLTKISRSF